MKLTYLSIFTINCTLLINCFTAFAAQETKVQNILLTKHCITTPQIWSLEAPDQFISYSDLRKKEGSSVFAQGNSIIIEGIVTDKNCIPLAGASIKIWQKNLGQKKAKTDITFYTGLNVSDTLGRFSFYTIMPLPEHDDEPMLYINISHPEIIDFETVMLFSKDGINSPSLKNLTKLERNLLVAKCRNCNDTKAVPIYDFRIITDGKPPYKDY